MSDSHAPAPEEATTARQVTVHEHAGGDAVFVELVERFYVGVAGDARLRPMYPEDTARALLLEYFERAAHAMINVAS